MLLFHMLHLHIHLFSYGTLYSKWNTAFKTECYHSILYPFILTYSIWNKCILNEILPFKMECYHSILYALILTYLIWNKCILNEILPFKMKCCHSILYPFIWTIFIWNKCNQTEILPFHVLPFILTYSIWNNWISIYFISLQLNAGGQSWDGFLPRPILNCYKGLSKN